MLKQLKLFADEPEPASDEAKIATVDFELHIQAYTDNLYLIKFNILVWGPSLRSQSPVAIKRRAILRQLREEKHHCWFSEEFKTPPDMSLKSYELAQARAADMIILLVEPHVDGSLGEMHDFCSHEELLPKILLFFPEVMRHTYNGGGLVKDLDKGFRIVEWYKEIDIRECHVLTTIVEWVRARRSYVYSHTPMRSGG